MKYYFVSYQYHFNSAKQEILNSVLDIHPIEWLLSKNSDGKSKYTIIFYDEITEEQYRNSNYKL